MDFVDVDVTGDVELFVDPRALRYLQTAWGEECVALIQNFFETLLHAIKRKDHRVAKSLLEALHEPNETHLGLSTGDRSRGRAMSKRRAEKIHKALVDSVAVRTGLLVDLEDTALMIYGISSDIISDITTNLIREKLISYTQEMCREYDIPMEAQVVSGIMWDPHSRKWKEEELVELPMANDRKLLLVPKSIVRRKLDYNAGEYYNHYILSHLQEAELANPNSELIRLLKDGTPKVTKKDVAKKYIKKGLKTEIVKHTLENPEIIERYRNKKRNDLSPPLSNNELAILVGTEPPDYDHLLRRMTDTPTGNLHAHDYHMRAKDLLTALFYPHLEHPRVEAEINEGTKRIDIAFTNIANSGFFRWLSNNYSAPNVFIECKNYSKDLGNPEVDQMLGRFSKSRGEFGIIICRSIENRERATVRCRSLAQGQLKYIIILDDLDMSQLVREASKGIDVFSASKSLFRARFDDLIM